MDKQFSTLLNTICTEACVCRPFLMARLLSIVLVCLLLLLLVQRWLSTNARRSKHVTVADPCKRLHQLQREFTRARGEHRFRLLLAVGDVYSHGSYPDYLPEDALAAECYKTVSACAYPSVAAVAAAKLAAGPLCSDDRAGAHLPSSTGQELCVLAFAELQRQKAADAAAQLHQRKLHQQQNIAACNNARLQIALERSRRDAAVAADAAAVDTLLQEVAVFEPDAQNVHDSAVVSGVASNAQALLRQCASGFVDVRKEVSECLSFCAELTAAQKGDADAVLNALGSAKHSKIGCSDLQALQGVWAKIQSTQQPEQRANLIETLGKQLASGVEHGIPVCLTGRIARIVSALDGTEHSTQRIRPLEAVRAELATLAGRVRDDVLKRCSTADTAAYERGELEGPAREMKDSFTQQATATYVQELKMATAVIEPLLELYSSVF